MNLRYGRDGLIPVVVQDHRTNEVLMVAWSNAEAVELMMTTGYTHFWSRSRERLWKKGEESGNVQRIVSIQTDCDDDTLLVRVEQTGAACHTGEPTCFHKTLTGEPGRTAGILPELIRVLEDLKARPDDESYTCKLMADDNKMCKKIVEEAAEFVLAVKDDDEDGIAWELADLIYHTLVAVVAKDVDLGKTFDMLEGRRQ